MGGRMPILKVKVVVRANRIAKEVNITKEGAGTTRWVDTFLLHIGTPRKNPSLQGRRAPDFPILALMDGSLVDDLFTLQPDLHVVG